MIKKYKLFKILPDLWLGGSLACLDILPWHWEFHFIIIPFVILNSLKDHYKNHNKTP